MASKRATKMDAVLRHLAAGGEIQDFPGTKFENLALARSVERRGLVVWDKEGNRYVLTPAGWSALTPRRFGVPSMVVSTAIGAAIGAAALAFLWLPGLEGRDSAYGHATASLAMAKPVTPPAAPAVDASGRSLARVPVSTTPIAPTPVSTTAPAPAPAPAAPAEPVQAAAADPIPEQAAAEPAPSSVKETKKPHHRTARHTDHYGNWRSQRYYADPRYDLGSPRYSYR